MSNLQDAREAMAERLSQNPRLKEITVLVHVHPDSDTASRLEAVGKRDLEEHFIPYLNSGDTVEVCFVYG